MPPIYPIEDLEAFLTPELYSKYPYDVASFLQARVDHCINPNPSPAIMYTIVPYDTRQNSQTTLGGNALSTIEQAIFYQDYFRKLGMKSDVKIHHNFTPSSAQTIEWNGELRRLWAIGPFQVGEVLLRYAKRPQLEVDLAYKEDFIRLGINV